jgi:hypothetical protein
MWKRRAFRPLLREILEVRIVPASTPTTVMLGVAASLPPQVANSNQSQQAFTTFIAGYNQAVRSVLLAPGPGGAVDPSANRPAFDAQVLRALNTLADSLVAALGSNSANSALALQVRDAIIGGGPDSLESELLAIATPDVTSTTATQAFIDDSLQAIRQVSGQVAPLVSAAAGTPVAQVAASAVPAPKVDYGILPAKSASDVIQRVRASFSTFLTTYFRAARDVLLAPGPDGTVDPTLHRADFDADVQQALQALADDLTASLDGVPASTGLAARLVQVTVGDDPDSLGSQLAGIPTPAGAEADMVRAFTLESFRTVANAIALISGDVTQFLSASSGMK